MQIFGMKNVVVTASRPETREWAKKNGATHILNHREDLGEPNDHLHLRT